ncbi:DUF3768 domain-containing protein [Aureimonas frigidaquae]|uniref:DUF3768 domain-containing protein n=1 Tax=Aureimonas frigidaquae TaxID=424757 RepID=A0A0P0Z0K5_9HYPH|nr:DUF3768 domain-containing protein [Aureimonas frigidaquae]BAT27374.1 hypothetical protein [Aureimonas frigidaquae]
MTEPQASKNEEVRSNAGLPTAPRHEVIAALNDQFRQTLRGGAVFMTASVANISSVRLRRMMEAIRTFEGFCEEQDPYGEHDLGSIKDEDERFFWKIDYFDPSMRFGSQDPANPAITLRVMTIMRPEEY